MSSFRVSTKIQYTFPLPAWVVPPPPTPHTLHSSYCCKPLWTLNTFSVLYTYFLAYHLLSCINEYSVAVIDKMSWPRQLTEESFFKLMGPSWQRSVVGRDRDSGRSRKWRTHIFIRPSRESKLQRGKECFTLKTCSEWCISSSKAVAPNPPQSFKYGNLWEVFLFQSTTFLKCSYFFFFLSINGW